MRHADSAQPLTTPPTRRTLEELCRGLASATSEAGVFSVLLATAIRHVGFDRAAVVSRRSSGSLAIEVSMGLSPHFRTLLQNGDLPGPAELFGGSALELWELWDERASTACRGALSAEGVRGVGVYPIRSSLGSDVWLLGARDESGTTRLTGLPDLGLILTLTASAVDRQRALAERHAHARVVHAMGGACFERVRQGEWLYRGVTPELAEILGWSADDLESGRATAVGIKHPADRDRCAFEIGRCVASRELEYSTEYRILRPNGAEQRVREVGRVMEVDGDGAAKIVGVISPAEPATAVRLAAPPDAITPVFRQFPLPACDLDLDGRFIRVNDAFRSYLGAGMDTLAGSTLDDMLHADDLPRRRALWAEMTEGRTSMFQTPQRWRRADGTFVPMQAWGFATTYLADARPVVRCILVDGGEISRLRDELVEHRAKLQSFYEQAAVGMAEIGLDGRFISLNPRYAEMLGYRREELVGKDWRMISFGADTPRCESKLAEVSAGAIAEFTLEKRYVRRDGSTIWVIVAVSRVCDAQGRLERFAAVTYDVTDRRRLQEHLAEIGVDRANTPGRSLRVLVVDDEPSVLTTVGAMLEFSSFEADTASTLAEARAALRAGDPYDVVLCDAGLGVGGEAALLRELRTAAPSTTAVLMTGDAAIPPDSEALRKPFSVEELAAAILKAAGVRSDRAT